jgi:5-oxoprolinase (ATP-hydrolysing)
MSVAEAMGRALQQTSISTNIKERLDFSCALFASSGDLVANAPFIPVHLGEGLKPGDVILANSPTAGGSHLPDLTVITPVFSRPCSSTPSNSPEPEKKPEIIFFTASRGHHSDIGGTTPGSMPSNSHSLFQEGACITSFKLVNEGVYDGQGLRKRMVDDPAQGEGCSGCRDFGGVESDLKAVSRQCGLQSERAG